MSDIWQGLASPVTQVNPWEGLASPVSNQQQAGNPPPQGEQPAPANTNGFGNDQGFGLLNKIRGYGVDQPDTTYGNILPFARNEKTGETSLAFPEAIRAPIRGITELMARSGGYMPPETDSGPSRNQISDDALGALTMLSPSSVAMQSKMAPFNSGQQMPEPVGNQLIKFGDKLQPGAMGDAEDAAFNQIMQPPKGKQPGSNLMAGFKARKPEELTEAAVTQKSSAGNLYKQMRDVGATLNSDAANNLAGSVDSALQQNLFIPQLNPKTLGIVQHLKDAIEKNGGIGLDELDQYRRLLGRVGGSEDGVSAGAVRRAIDDTVNALTNEHLESGSTEAVKLLNQGRSAYQNASQFEDVSALIAKANGDPNKIHQSLTRFLNNENNTRGWSQEKLDALRFAANTGNGEYILKGLGRFGLEPNNVFMPLFGGSAVGAAFGGPAGLGLTAAGTVARQGHKYIARGKAENLLKFLEGAQ